MPRGIKSCPTRDVLLFCVSLPSCLPSMDWLSSLRLRLVGQIGWVVVVCALAVSGCTPLREYWDNGLKVGPDYFRPVPEVTGDWIDADSEQIRSASATEVDWWEQFNDPVLGQLVNRAYEQNLPLREAGFRVLASRAAYNIAVGGFFPQSQGPSIRCTPIHSTRSGSVLRRKPMASRSTRSGGVAPRFRRSGSRPTI